MPSSIKEIITNDFIHFCNEQTSQFVTERYKFHISLDPKNFREKDKEIRAILYKALEEQAITRYKIFNFDTPLPPLEEKVPGTSMTLRQINLPFTVYLYEDCDSKVQQVIELINKIEECLRGINPGDPRTRMEADLNLTTHIVFRQACLNGHNTYLAANHEKARELAAEGTQSNYYQTLKPKFSSANTTDPIGLVCKMAAEEKCSTPLSDELKKAIDHLIRLGNLEPSLINEGMKRLIHSEQAAENFRLLYQYGIINYFFSTQKTWLHTNYVWFQSLLQKPIMQRFDRLEVFYRAIMLTKTTLGCNNSDKNNSPLFHDLIQKSTSSPQDIMEIKSELIKSYSDFCQQQSVETKPEPVNQQQLNVTQMQPGYNLFCLFYIPRQINLTNQSFALNYLNKGFSITL